MSKTVAGSVPPPGINMFRNLCQTSVIIGSLLMLDWHQKYNASKDDYGMDYKGSKKKNICCISIFSFLTLGSINLFIYCIS